MTETAAPSVTPTGLSLPRGQVIRIKVSAALELPLDSFPCCLARFFLPTAKVWRMLILV